jgi:hypothetical protein
MDHQHDEHETALWTCGDIGALRGRTFQMLEDRYVGEADTPGLRKFEAIGVWDDDGTMGVLFRFMLSDADADRESS